MRASYWIFIETKARRLMPRQNKFAIAPMMDWTDRHCRLFHRQMTRHALLYTEMVVADAIIHGDRQRLLGFNDVEHPVAFQVGGSEPGKLAEVAKIVQDFGYDEINLNCGCPSDRVQSGAFGACLMQEPKLVAQCVAAMKAVVKIPVTVKCRIGVDDQEPREALFQLVSAISRAGVDAVWVHARKAWLQGLSPKENRDVPPLDYALVYKLKREYPNLFIGINGGITDLNQSAEHLKQVDGVMLGRAAYQEPALLLNVDRLMYGETNLPVELDHVIEAMSQYIDQHVSNGGKANQVTRHMIGLFNGRPGARRWRQMLTVDALKHGANGALLREAYHIVLNAAPAAEAA
jgi:tRNA-dihydrouridine synthase A